MSSRTVRSSPVALVMLSRGGIGSSIWEPTNPTKSPHLKGTVGGIFMTSLWPHYKAIGNTLISHYIGNCFWLPLSWLSCGLDSICFNYDLHCQSKRNLISLLSSLDKTFPLTATSLDKLLSKLSRQSFHLTKLSSETLTSWKNFMWSLLIKFSDRAFTTNFPLSSQQVVMYSPVCLHISLHSALGSRRVEC